VKVWADGGLMNADVHFSAANVNRLYGGDGMDTLIGEMGNDILEGGAGNDELTGGVGADTFYFRQGSDSDIVTDFQNDIDAIVFVGFGFTDATDALNNAQSYQDANNDDFTVFTFQKDTLTVMGVSSTDLADDIFV
jgi:Ca2+-binding RTX toxin-like protein